MTGKFSKKKTPIDFIEKHDRLGMSKDRLHQVYTKKLPVF
jgi:hypothetical protein